MSSVVDKFIHNIWRKEHFRPNKAILLSFTEKFGEPLNVEWHKYGKISEVVFYRGGTEYIARFESTGDLVDTKCNLQLHLAKPAIAKQAELVGELMNLIEVNRHGKLFYEIIARDKNLDRYSLFLEEDGALIEKKKL